MAGGAPSTRATLTAPPRAHTESFSERFRGTEWGTPMVEEARESSGSAPRHGRYIVIALGAVILAMAAVTAFVALPGPAGLLGDAGGASPRTGVRPIVNVDASATPRPRITLAPRDGRARTASPQPRGDHAGDPPPRLDTPDPAAEDPGGSGGRSTDGSGGTTVFRPVPGTSQRGLDIIGRLSDRVTAEQTPFHVTVDGRTLTGNEQIVYDIALDVSGQDYAGEVVVRQGGVSYSVALVAKDGRTFVRPAGEPWTYVEGYRPDGPAPNPFADQAGYVDYRGAKTVEGRRLHHLRFPEATDLGAAFLDAHDGGMYFEESSLDLYVTGDGTPVLYELSYRGTVTDAGVQIRVEGELRYRFSRFGKRVTIVEPDDYVQANPGEVDAGSA
ncbi:MAG: hypothetical protein H0V12_06200 [Chloroflexi bacterium]|nr:hypothetical protein [Chloroflexota bacterium]